MEKIKRVIMALLLAGSLLTGIAGTAGAVPGGGGTGGGGGGTGGGGGGTGGGSTTSTITQTENFQPTGSHACQGGHNCGVDFSQNGTIGP